MDCCRRRLVVEAAGWCTFMPLVAIGENDATDDAKRAMINNESIILRRTIGRRNGIVETGFG